MNDASTDRSGPYRAGYFAGHRYRIGDAFLGAVNEPEFLMYFDRADRAAFAAGYEAAVAHRYPTGILLDTAGRLIAGQPTEPAGGVHV